MAAQNDNRERRWQRLQARLDALEARRVSVDPAAADALRAELRKFVSEVTEAQRRTLSDDECRERFPDYVAAELAQLDAAALYPEVARHLALSPTVEEEYQALLAIALAEERGDLPPVEALPPSPLSSLDFLPPLRQVPSLSDYVRLLVREWVTLHVPRWLDGLDRRADIVFRQIAALGGHVEPQAVRTLSGDAGADSPIGVLLTTYVATQNLIEAGAASSAVQLPPETLEGVARAEVSKAAEGFGMGADAAQTLGNELARLMARDPELLALIATMPRG